MKRSMAALMLVLTLGGLSACGEERLPSPAPSTEQKTPRPSLPGQAPDGDIVDTNGAFVAYYICEPDGSATYINNENSVHVDSSKFCVNTTNTTLR